MYEVTDFRLGQTILVHSKDLLIVDCDSFTYQ